MLKKLRATQKAVEEIIGEDSRIYSLREINKGNIIVRPGDGKFYAFVAASDIHVDYSFQYNESVFNEDFSFKRLRASVIDSVYKVNKSEDIYVAELDIPSLSPDKVELKKPNVVKEEIVKVDKSYDFLFKFENRDILDGIYKPQNGLLTDRIHHVHQTFQLAKIFLE